MFDNTQYVPVIRWKRGERWALANLHPEVRSRVTPLIEFIPQNFEEKKIDKCNGLSGRMNVIASEIKDSWGCSPCFLDFDHVEDVISGMSKSHPLELIGNAMRFFALKSIPVTGVSRTARQQRAADKVAAALGNGIGIRVTAREVLQESRSNEIRALLGALGRKPQDAHLIVDLQALDGPAPLPAAIVGAIPQVADWATLTVVAGAFPSDLTQYEKNTQQEEPRADWLWWRNAVSNGMSLVRTPTFGDYTVQYGRYVEPPSFCNPSASIRYTADSYWVIMRGEGIMNDDGPGRDGYVGNAMLLLERAEFCGPDFSAGDGYIHSMGRQGTKVGSPETWIRAAINHHITFTVRQIASLTGS